MTDPTTPPAYGAPAAAPAPTPAAPPAKKSNAGRIIGIVIAVLLVGGGIVYRFVLPAIEDAKFKVGACLDTIPLTSGSTTVDPTVVDCSSAEAESKIIAIVDGANAASAPTACPEEWFAAIERDGKLLCLVEA